MSAAPHGRSWGHYLFGVGLNAVLFVAVGPLIGTFVVGAVTATVATGNPLAGLWTVGVFAGSFLFSVFLGYMHSWQAALITGAVVAVLTSFLSAPRLLYPVAAMTGALAALVLVPPNLTESRINAAGLGLAVAGAVAALVCTRLAAGLRLSPPAETRAG